MGEAVSGAAGNASDGGEQGSDLLDQAETALRAKQGAENFPVALRVLPGALRRHLTAVYDVARVVDDLGDEAEGDRTALLEEFGADVGRVWSDGRPRSRVLRGLVPTVRECGLDQEPFDNLVRANLQDQKVTRYATYEDLLGYCKLSAEPVGRIVLQVFGDSTPQRVALSDRVCNALQLIEHWQDVAEDRRGGRIYLPQEDLERYGVAEEDLDRPTATPALRRLMTFEIARAAELLDSGAPLVGTLRGWARLAIGGYVAGGRAALDGLRRTRGDVLAENPRVRRFDQVRYLTLIAWRNRGRS
jgi:squalene synthase HpnC